MGVARERGRSACDCRARAVLLGRDGEGALAGLGRAARAEGRNARCRRKVVALELVKLDESHVTAVDCGGPPGPGERRAGFGGEGAESACWGSKRSSAACVFDSLIEAVASVPAGQARADSERGGLEGRGPGKVERGRGWMARARATSGKIARASDGLYLPAVKHSGVRERRGGEREGVQASLGPTWPSGPSGGTTHPSSRVGGTSARSQWYR